MSGSAASKIDQAALAATLEGWRSQIDSRLSAWLDELAARPGCPPRLAEAMRYSLLGEGKRLRPLLCLAAVRALGRSEAEGLGAACALEFVHAYSLIHDDLPAMDDDDFRRGRPTVHRAFGEALAILAGDALLTHAFQVLARSLPDRGVAAEAVELLAEAAGVAGMVGGQVDDVEPIRSPPSVEQVESVHLRKTGRMFEAALGLGALLAQANPAASAALSSGGRALGLAFQVADDLLAHAGDQRTLKRPTGSDAQRDRRTHPRAAGAEASRLRALELLEQARASFLALPHPEVLLGLIEQVSARVR